MRYSVVHEGAGNDDNEQQRFQHAASKYFDILESGDSRRSENVRLEVRQRLRRAAWTLTPSSIPGPFWLCWIERTAGLRSAWTRFNSSDSAGNVAVVLTELFHLAIADSAYCQVAGYE